MPHTVKFILQGPSHVFDRYQLILLDGQKQYRMRFLDDGTYQHVYEDVDLRDRHGEESVRFSYEGQGIPGDEYRFTVLVDHQEKRIYEGAECTYHSQHGRDSILDIISI